MVSTISFIQAKLQHSFADSRIITRTVSVKGIDMTLIEEPCYREDCIRGSNISGYTLYSARGKDRPMACILAIKMNIWALLGFSCRDLVATLVKYIEDETRTTSCLFCFFAIRFLGSFPVKEVGGTCAIL